MLTTLPSIRNSTLATPVSSDAEAVTSTVLETVSPSEGESILAVGSVVSSSPPVS